MNKWFDLCNSKEAGQDKDWKTWVSPPNAASIASEFLKILKWFQDWKESLIEDNGTFHGEHFVTDETYESMQRCCYGFASMIYDQVIKRKRTILLCRINQDCCEMHFGHCRAASGSTNHPTQYSADASARVSGLKRLKKQTNGNVTTEGRSRKKIKLLHYSTRRKVTARTKRNMKK